MSASTVATPVTRVRAEWVDTAKGIAIILVVLFHASIFMQDIGLAGFWGRITVVLDTFRMPLFFFTAGMFASSSLARPFRAMLHRRVALLAWVYVLWTIVYTIVFNLVPVPGRGSPSWLGLLLSPVWPNESTWFVWGLAVYFILSWAMRRLPVVAQLVLALIPAILFGMNIVDSGNTALDKVGTYFIFFVAAVHVGPAVIRLSPRLRGWHAPVIVAVYGLVVVAVFRAGLFYFPFVRLTLGFLAVAAGLAAGIALSRLPAFAWLSVLGTRTLPIYLLHFYPVLLVSAALAPVAEHLTTFGSLIPPALTVFALAFALAVHRVTRRVPGLYTLPKRLQPRG